MAIAKRVPRVAQSLLRAAPRPSLWPHLAIWGLIALVVVVLAATTRAYLQGAMGYVDNGDGYYLYAAHRLAQGAVLYRDVMGTQPPLTYVLGAAVFKLGGALTTVRMVSALLRALSTALVVLIAAITKLSQGAWVVVVLVPVIVMACRRVHAHYESARKALTPRLDAGGEKRFAPYLRLYLKGNPLSDKAKSQELPALQGLGVRVMF